MKGASKPIKATEHMVGIADVKDAVAQIGERKVSSLASSANPVTSLIGDLSRLFFKKRT